MFIKFRLFLLLLLLSGSFSLSAQMERTMYLVFNVDSAKTVDLDLAGLYEIHSWAGSSILVETNIQVSHASPEILDYLVKQGRYDVVADTISPTQIKISTRFRDRKPIKTPDGECTEIATAKIFVPDTFVWTDDKKTLTRKPQ